MSSSFSQVSNHKSWNELRQTFLYIDDKSFTKKTQLALTNSSIDKYDYVICSSRYCMHNRIIFRAKFHDWKINPKHFFKMKFSTDLSKDIVLPDKWEPFLLISRLGNVDNYWHFLWHNLFPKFLTISIFSFTWSASLPWLSFSFREKEKK